MDASERQDLHRDSLNLLSAIRRRAADMIDKRTLDSLSAAFVDAKIRTIHDDLREVLNFLDAAEGW